jgi:PAS domain S-box-containing protein
MSRTGSGEDCATQAGCPVESDECQRQQALLKTAALQHAIVNSALFSSIGTDENGIIRIFNAGAQHRFGYKAVEVVNRFSLTDLFDAAEVAARAQALSLELRTTIAPGFEALVCMAGRGLEDIYVLTCLLKDGSRAATLVSVSALRDAQDAVIGYLLVATDSAADPSGAVARAASNTAIFYDRDYKLQADSSAARDVSERKKAEAQLFESEARTRAILAAAVDAIIIIDASGTIESLNKAAERLFGHTSSEMVGQNVKMLMPAPYKAEHDGYLRNYTSTGVKKIIGIGREVVGLRKNGETFPMELAVSEVQTGGRRLFTGIVRDITERKLIERRLHEKRIALERASRMKSEFLATMSHELRTPLNAIIGFSEALKDGLIGPMSDSQTEYIGDIFTSGQHLLSLINDILDLSKVEAGMMTLELEATDLKVLLSGSLSIVKEKAAAHRIRLELSAGEDLGAPYLDPRRTKQIVYNLLSNAVKFSADGSRVVLSARCVPRSEVGMLGGVWPVHGFPLADNEHNEFVEISVSDQGIGISRQNMEKLFKAFSQIDSSLARRFEGTGLGLAMVKQLTELHGGTVAVCSAEGEGARFAAWLPLRSLAV